MLRARCSDTNQNIKRLVYCRYGKQSLTFRAKALRQRKTTCQLMFLYDEGPTLETLDFAFYIGSIPTDQLFSLTKGQCSKR